MDFEVENKWRKELPCNKRPFKICSNECQSTLGSIFTQLVKVGNSDLILRFNLKNKKKSVFNRCCIL
jgi:hypothetical protein